MDYLIGSQNDKLQTFSAAWFEVRISQWEGVGKQK